MQIQVAERRLDPGSNPAWGMFIWYLGPAITIQRSTQISTRPRASSYPLRVLYKNSRAASSVGVMYHVSGPNTGSNPGGRWIQKKSIIRYNHHRIFNNIKD